MSEDGGKSFTAVGGFVGMHGDVHDVFVDPSNPKHVFAGDDGGLWISFDGANKWWKTDNLPISQFYHVSVDKADPYQVYGGLQDNSSWVGDSAYPGGITSSRWENMYGGDGFWMFADPTDPRLCVRRGAGRHHRPRQHAHARDARHPAEARRSRSQALHKLRFNWNTPDCAVPARTATVYIGAQFLFRSRDHGQTWERISPDLTTNDPEKQKQEQSGGITVDNSAAEMHTTIYSISESPLQRGADLGRHRRRQRAAHARRRQALGQRRRQRAGLPKSAWVSWVEASRFDAGTAYVAFDRHTFGDMAPYVYATTDFGKTWARMVTPPMRRACAATRT